jgi:glutaminase
MSITTIDGKSYGIGLEDKKFSIQSISKVFAFSLAFEILQQEVFKRVGREPSGDPFNSLVQLEYEKGIPRNPFINAGALVVTDILLEYYEHKRVVTDKMLDLICEVSGSSNIYIDSDIAISEIKTGFRNQSLANLMKSFHNIKMDVDEIISIYSNHCAISMNTKQLSRSMLYMANGGVDPMSKKKILDKEQTNRINAIMLTCGHYDASGDFAYRVGLPGKSGVGGGIVAVVPNKMGIAVYSPALNKQGNSLMGTKALELFAKKANLSIF